VAGKVLGSLCDRGAAVERQTLTVKRLDFNDLWEE